MENKKKAISGSWGNEGMLEQTKEEREFHSKKKQNEKKLLYCQ